jgi:putative membrane protein
LLPFKPGFVAIANDAERRTGRSIPLIPVGLRYAKGKKWNATIAFGTPVSTEEFASRDDLIRHLEQEVARLSGIDAPGADDRVHEVCRHD